jgi:tRNA-Thr(GGU) m(6)t(6)A37 methyltransferase TsaA
MPLQTVASKGVQATIELYPEYVEGLGDVAGFSHLWLLSYLHANSDYKLQVTPFLDNQPRGVFATRSPRRPNSIGLSLVRLIAVEHNILHIEDVDLLDGTPLLDIKPYLPQFDHHNAAEGDPTFADGVRIGWFAGRVEKVYSTRAHDRMK